MEPIIEIVSNDGRTFRAGVKYARGFDGANAEAVEVFGLEAGTFKLKTLGWVNGNVGLGGCGQFTFG